MSCKSKHLMFLATSGSAINLLKKKPKTNKKYYNKEKALYKYSQTQRC